MFENRILWLDLETTGVEPDAEILEVGMLVTEGLDEVLAAESWVCMPPRFNPFDLPDAVYDMHSASGLLDDLRRNGKHPDYIRNSARTFIGEWFGSYVTSPGQDVTVAGSGIDRFDLPLLRSKPAWLDVTERFHWRTLDVSGTKRLASMAGAEIEAPGTGHRALDDCRWALEVARAAVTAFQPVVLDPRPTLLPY